MKEKRTKARSGAAELPLGLVASDLVTPSALRTTGLVYPGSLNPIAGCVRNHSHGYESSAPHSRHSSALPLGRNSGRKQAEPQQIRKQKVINTSRARGMTYADGDNNFYEPLTDHACGRARARKRLPFSRAEVALWRELIFADGIEDPVKVAVKDAVRDFGSRKDFTIWAWYANRIGINNFLELYFEQQSVMRRSILRNPAAAFHARLKRFYAAYAPKEGGRHV